eukprot:227825-Chlamydomonas_euryale.AAC.1
MEQRSRACAKPALSRYGTALSRSCKTSACALSAFALWNSALALVQHQRFRAERFRAMEQRSRA